MRVFLLAGMTYHVNVALVAIIGILPFFFLEPRKKQEQLRRQKGQNADSRN